MPTPNTHLRLRLTPRTIVEVTQRQYDDTLARFRLYLSRGATPEDAADLAIHQLRLQVWAELHPHEQKLAAQRIKRRNQKAAEEQE
jgi:hypothetical protein